jgi:hypothetical protein
MATLSAPPAHEPRPRATPADGAPEAGRVVGLAAVVVPRQTAPTPATELPAYFRDQRPLRHASARPIVEHAPLTEATDAYLGEPVAPSVPPPASSTPFGQQSAPRPDPRVEAKTDAGTRFREALANLHTSGLPRYVSPSEAAWQASERPTGPPPSPPIPPIPSGRPPGLADDQPRLTHRRNSLAQSRRLGLGAPLRRTASDDAGEDTGGDGQADAEPAEVEVLPPTIQRTAPTRPAIAPPVGAAPPLAPEPATTDAEPAPDDSASSQAPDSAPADGGSPVAPSDRVPLQPVVVAARSITGGTARPTAATTPLVFRGRSARAEQRAAITRAVERAVVTRAPAELAQALRSSHGIDVSDVPVQRDTAAGSEARERRARAFTRGGRVFLPQDAGHLGSATARGLLAHELVHAAQQRRLGGTLPDESTPDGRALEAEAQAAEHMYTSAPTHFEEPELIHAPQPVTAGWVDSRITQHAGPPIDYLDPNATLTEQQRTAFQQASEQAVREVMANRSDANFEDSGALRVAEQQYLDVINQALADRNEAPQSQLSDEDRDRVRSMLTDGGAGGQSAAATEVRRDSRTAGGFFDNLFGGSATAGADVSGIARFFGGGNEGSATSMRLGGAPASEQAGGTQPGPGGQGGPAQSGQRTGAGTAGTSASQEVRRNPRSAGGFLDNLFGASAVASVGGDFAGLSRWGDLNVHGAVHHDAGRDQGAAQTGTRPGMSHAQSHYASAPGGVDSQTGHLRGGAEGADTRSAGDRLEDVEMTDLDDLATRLYERLRSRLRRELLVDRERAGLLTDFR